MATLIDPCVKCSTKGVGIFKCQGCSSAFCRRHATEHRTQLNQQLDDIVHEHDQLQQLIIDEGNHSHPLINQINQWEHNSIGIIQQLAENIRQDVHRYLQLQKNSSAETLKHLSQRLRQAREDDDYIENDIQLWSMKLSHLKRDLTTSLTLHEDPKSTLITKIQLSPMKQQSLPNDIFSRSLGEITIEDNGKLAIHSNQTRGDAFLCGQNEYSHGKHRIRFLINKKAPQYITTFGIASMYSQSSVYGWSTDDATVGCGYHSSDKHFHQRDLKGETNIQLELIIDCDQRKISYLNERTKSFKEIPINLDSCPFPWQLYFYLYDTNDRVRLLPVNRT